MRQIKKTLWKTFTLNLSNQDDLTPLLVEFAKNKINYDLVSYDGNEIEIKLSNHITKKSLKLISEDSDIKFTIDDVKDVFKSPLHESRMRIIKNYDYETQCKMKDSIVKNYLETIQSISDGINYFLDNDMRTEHLITDTYLLKEWTIGLENFLVEWKNKYE